LQVISTLEYFNKTTLYLFFNQAKPGYSQYLARVGLFQKKIYFVYLNKQITI